MKTILVAIDFSPSTQSLLNAAIDAATADSKVYLVHVAAPEPDFVGYSVGPQYIREDRADELKDEHALLGNYKKLLVLKGIRTEALLVSGPTVETLLAEIEKLKADLLIIGKKGHSTLFEVFIGSVCRDVLTKLQIPALVIPESDS